MTADTLSDSEPDGNRHDVMSTGPPWDSEPDAGETEVLPTDTWSDNESEIHIDSECTDIYTISNFELEMENMTKGH